MRGLPRSIRAFRFIELTSVNLINDNDFLIRKTSMNLRFSPLTLALTGLLSTVLTGAVQAQNLVTLFEAAKDYDAAFKSAQSQYTATIAKADQGLGSLLPTAGLSANTTKTEVSPANTSTTISINSQAASLSASQPIYRPANLATYQQARKQLELASAVLTAAEQDLIVRVSQAYFDVLSSKDSLTFVRAQKTAVAEQLAAAKRNFEVGTTTITDTREAQARYDLVLAQEIAAENDLRVKKLALDLLVGANNTEPKSLTLPVQLQAPQPSDINTWVMQSANHPSVSQARVALDIATLEIDKAKAGHKPTLDLNANYGPTRYNSSTLGAGKGLTSAQSDNTTASVNLTFNMPLFAGFATQNRIKETVALEDKARTDLEGVQRQVAQATRTAYLGLQSGLGQVNALAAAEASSQSALDANQLGYKVGVRINIDVLNSQSQLYQTKRDLAKARYDVLVGQLKLRQANGSLKADDLQAVNALLAK
jgi:outer membrane protein